MASLNSDEKREIVREELSQLVKAKYMSLDLAAKVINVHTKYYENIEKTEKVKQPIKAKEKVEKELQLNTMTQAKETESKTQEEKLPVPTPTTVTAPPKKALTAQQVRERNITWALNLGVILLLLGGLVLATSTWDTLGNWTKTGLIAAVSILFFGLAWLTSRVLHIHKTAFAFLVLGSLFLPIVIVSAGYFELFGTYLSFSGEGKFLFGAIGTLVVLPVYISFALRLPSRLFVWFSYVSISVFVGLLIAALYLPVDGFYLGIMLFNAVLILAYRGLRRSKKIEVFTKEFISYIQANLILSTLLMLVFYDHELMYSANLILTAIIYFSMIFVTRHKSYHFVFTAMLVYGAYQLIENSILAGVSEIAYALVGAIFLAIPKLIKDTKSLQKVFHITSAIVSALAFLYISIEGFALRMNEGSIVLMVAYLIIALNFAYLTTTVKDKMFTYLSPIFLMSALYELALLGKSWVGYETIILPFFVLALVLYVLLGCLGNFSLVKAIKQSTRDISGLVMLLSILICFYETGGIEQSAMLLLFSILTLVVMRYEERSGLKMVAPWIHAIALGLSVIIFYHELVERPDSLFVISPIQLEGIILGSLVVLGVSYLWRFLKQKDFSLSNFYSAQILYGIGLLLTMTIGSDALIRVMIALGGVGMAYLLYKRTNWPATPYVISGISLLFYIYVIAAVHSEVSNVPELFVWFEFVLGAIFLLGTAILIGKKDPQLVRAYQWVGQIYLPFALLMSLFFSEEDAVWAFIIATIIYGLTVKQAKSEWQIKTFLYAGFTTFWGVLMLLFFKLDWDSELSYTFLLTSIIVGVGWFISNEAWKKRIAYYLIPFSTFGIMSFMLHYPYDLEMFIVTLLYTIFVLYLLHQAKWDVLSIIPLLLVYTAVGNYSSEVFSEGYQLISYAIFGIALTGVGRFLYPSLYQHYKNSFKLDWYTISALFAFINLYSFTSGSLLFKVLPGILIVGFLFLQRARVAGVESKWITFISFTYLLQPYYVVLDYLNLPGLFERELYVLPWIIVAIALRSYVMKDHRSITNYIQWAVLVIVALLLVQDGLASNTIYDALIVGVLSLASLVAGMIYQIKSFFFVGTGVLLFNVFMQTRPYWGNLPWWGYLLIAGSILITIASYNEWQKQRTTEGKETLVSKFKKNIIERIRKWD